MRRAVLTIGLDLMECGDDSSGYLSHVMTTAMVTYAGTDWCSTGIPPQHFWPDFVKIATLLANYGVPVDQEVALCRLAGVAPHLDLVCAITDGLHAEYLVARRTWHAGQVRRQHAHALAATGTGLKVNGDGQSIRTAAAPPNAAARPARVGPGVG